MTEKNNYSLTVQTAANGHLVTYHPEPPSPSDLLDMSFEAVMPFNNEAPDKDPKALMDKLKDMRVRSQNFGQPVKMLYYSTDSERMMDDIQNFLSTGIPPAAPNKN